MSLHQGWTELLHVAMAGAVVPLAATPPVIYEKWTYLAVFAVLVGCGLGLPIPEDVPILTGGWLCSRGLANIYVMIPVAMAGALCGDFIVFGIGYRFGHQVVYHRYFSRIVHPARLLMAEKLFQRHGLKLVFFARFLPGFRPMVFMSSGVLRVPFWKFAIVDALAACISVPLLVTLGMVFGHNFERLQSDVRTVTHVLVVVAIAAVVIGLLIYGFRSQRKLMNSTDVDRHLDRETLAKLPPGGQLPAEPPASETTETGTEAQTSARSES